MEENKSHGEIQSKTVLINDNEGVNDMLSALNVGREKMEKEKKRKLRNTMIKKIAIIGAVVFAVAIVLILLI